MPYDNPRKETLRSREYRRRTREQRKQELRETTTMLAPLQAPAVEMKVKGPKHGLTIAMLTDTQVRKGVPTEHLKWYGQYIASKQPDVIVCIGDFVDMTALSSYDIAGSVNAEGKRYADDIASSKRAMELFLNPIRKAAGYSPVMVMTYGNHEDRINRAIHSDPRRLMGVISLDDLKYAEYGWKCIPFLQPVTIGGVAFCHYFPSGVMGRAITKPDRVLRTLHMSAFAGHQQGRDIAYSKRADGRDLTAIISGSFYQHEEAYLSPFTNRHWRGTYFLHEVKDGSFDEMALSIDYLKRKFG